MKKLMKHLFVMLLVASFVPPFAMAAGEMGLDHKVNRMDQEIVLDDAGRVPCSNGQCELAPMPELDREPADADDLMEDFWQDRFERLDRRNF